MKIRTFSSVEGPGTCGENFNWRRALRPTSRERSRCFCAVRKKYVCDGNHYRINAGKVPICTCIKKNPAKPKSVSVFKNDSGRLGICICNQTSFCWRRASDPWQYTKHHEKEVGASVRYARSSSSPLPAASPFGRAFASSQNCCRRGLRPAYRPSLCVIFCGGIFASRSASARCPRRPSATRHGCPTFAAMTAIEGVAGGQGAGSIKNFGANNL